MGEPFVKRRNRFRQVLSGNKPSAKLGRQRPGLKSANGCPHPDYRLPNEGTGGRPGRSSRMTEPLPVLIENSLQIAWDFLDRSGGIADPQQAAEILLQSIKTQILKGESRTLMLSNRAIAAFEQHQKAA